MVRRSSLNLLVYSFAVLMILLRPYFAYQMSMRGAFAKDPDAVSRLLQRLIKKKENHGEDANEAEEVMQSQSIEIILPVILLVLLHRRIFELLSLLLSSVNCYFNTVFRISPTNQYYRLISRLQI